MTTDFLVAPNEQQLVQEAEARLRHLSQVEAPVASLEVRFREAGQEKVEVVALPPSVLRALESLLGAGAAEANAKAIVAARLRELTPNQAAGLLGVSRPFLVKLLDEGKIPFRRVGAHRRIRVEALEAYQRAEEERQLEVMARLQAQAQELGMGY